MNSLIKSELCKSSTDSVLAGVCGGIAKRFKLESWVVRVGFVMGIIALGITPILYIVFAISFPKDSELHEAGNSKVLGVCSRLAKKMDWDIAIVRSVFLSCLLLSLIPSFGTTLLIYFIMHFVLPEQTTTAQSNVVDVSAKDLN